MFFSFFSQLHLIKEHFVVLGNPKHVKAGLQTMLQYYKKDWSSSKLIHLESRWTQIWQENHLISVLKSVTNWK